MTCEAIFMIYITTCTYQMTFMFIIIPDHEVYEYVDNIILIFSCIPEISCLEKDNR